MNSIAKQPGTKTPPIRGAVGRGALRLFVVTAILVASVTGVFSDTLVAPTVVLGRPTDHSVTLNVLAPSDLDVAMEYGTESGAQASSGPTTLRGGVPAELRIDGLEPDTAYFYRLQYRHAGGTDFAAAVEGKFHTKRAAGTSFTFAVESDPHLDSNTSPELFARSLDNVLARQPDFLVDVGDTFMSEKLASTRDSALDRHILLRSYFDKVCHSLPLFLVPGNHEGEAGWLNDGTPDNLAVWATSFRKQYFSNPEPDAFYSGDATDYPNVGLRQATFAWGWGDALFVSLDPFWFTQKPKGSTDNWSFTLGTAQYEWLKRTLESSGATFKFVFIHHLVGGLDSQARGGSEAASLYEWGGKNADGSDGFAQHRPGWAAPIHKLLVENHVSIVFHGHDHFYARQELDGVVYQEVPQPGWPGLTLPDPSSYGYRSGVFFPSSGDLLVTVSPTRVTVEYIRALLPKDERDGRTNAAIVHSYSIDAPSARGPRRRPVRR